LNYSVDELDRDLETIRRLRPPQNG